MNLSVSAVYDILSLTTSTLRTLERRVRFTYNSTKELYLADMISAPKHHISTELKCDPNKHTSLHVAEAGSDCITEEQDK